MGGWARSLTSIVYQVVHSSSSRAIRLHCSVHKPFKLLHRSREIQGQHQSLLCMLSLQPCLYSLHNIVLDDANSSRIELLKMITPLQRYYAIITSQISSTCVGLLTKLFQQKSSEYNLFPSRHSRRSQTDTGVASGNCSYPQSKNDSLHEHMAD